MSNIYINIYETSTTFHIDSIDVLIQPDVVVLTSSTKSIFTNVKPDMRIVREEIFGPVVVVTKFKDEEELIKMANDTIYGLASAVFSRDVSRALGVANRIQSGTVWVNCYNRLHSQVPFGGYKQSGIGREVRYQFIEFDSTIPAYHHL